MEQESKDHSKLMNRVGAFLRWFSLDRILALVAIAAGLVAIVFELELHRQVTTGDSKLNVIVSSLSTRYVAEFPHDLQSVRTLLSNAKEGDRVRILVDFIGYGHYSAPENFQKYMDSISDARRNGAKVQLLIYDDEAARADMCSQFSERDYACLSNSNDNNCEKPETLPQRREQFQHYFKYYDNQYHGRCVRDRKSGQIGFLNTLACTNELFCEQLQTQGPSIDIRAIKKTNGSEDQKTPRTSCKDAQPSDETVFFWMISDAEGAHNREMLLAYPNFSNATNGNSFRSSDERLMQIFADRFENLWAKAIPRTERCYSSNPLFP